MRAQVHTERDCLRVAYDAPLPDVDVGSRPQYVDTRRRLRGGSHANDWWSTLYFVWPSDIAYGHHIYFACRHYILPCSPFLRRQIKKCTVTDRWHPPPHYASNFHSHRCFSFHKWLTYKQGILKVKNLLYSRGVSRLLLLILIKKVSLIYAIIHHNHGGSQFLQIRGSQRQAKSFLLPLGLSAPSKMWNLWFRTW